MTAVEHPARDGTDGPVRPPVRVPFPVVDEVARHCLQEEEPETVHIEGSICQAASTRTG